MKNYNADLDINERGHLEKCPLYNDINLESNECECWPDKISNLLVETSKELETDVDHRLTLRIPKWLMDKLDKKRKQKVGSMSRNYFILELLEKTLK